MCLNHIGPFVPSVCPQTAFPSQLHVLIFFLNPLSPFRAASMYIDIGPSIRAWIPSQKLNP